MHQHQLEFTSLLQHQLRPTCTIFYQHHLELAYLMHQNLLMLTSNNLIVSSTVYVPPASTPTEANMQQLVSSSTISTIVQQGIGGFRFSDKSFTITYINTYSRWACCNNTNKILRACCIISTGVYVPASASTEANIQQKPVSTSTGVYVPDSSTPTEDNMQELVSASTSTGVYVPASSTAEATNIQELVQHPPSL
uniref:Uncharacterized protein n=1 Tax=Daphnia galeata TaxID=27404 RepID=A0A8J2WHC1_9CRUS|nr:unnamed protein product [Daphnia galeata]